MRNKIIAILSAIIVLLGGGVAVNQLGAHQEARFNTIDALTNFATSTGSYATTYPVKLLDKDPDRRYAVITNTSNATVYIYSTTANLTVDGTANGATTTITSLEGIPPGIPILTTASYILDADNMIYGTLWATSTLPNKLISVSYK